MSRIEEYKKPGTPVTNKQFEELIKLLRFKFLGTHSLPDWKGNKVAAWSEFKDDLTSKQTDLEIFNQDLFKTEKTYYIYFEFSKKLNISTLISIEHYFANKPIWINHDAYIFPETFEWCLVINHDDEFTIYKLNDHMK